MTPAVSVIIPVFNCERYITEAVRSVQRQTGIATEIIVVDDGSTDRSASVAEACGATVVHQAHAGIGLARNCGIQHARHDEIAFLDADDIWDPEKLQRQLVLWRRQQATGAVFSRVQQFISPELESHVKAGLVCPRGDYDGICAGTLLTSKRVMEAIGNFPEDRKLGEFVDWYARLKDSNMPVAIVGRTLMYRRIYDGNTGIQQADSRKDYLLRLKAIIDRRKA